MPLEISIRELPLSGIRSQEQLALFILASLGVTEMPSNQEELNNVMPDVQILLNFMDSARKGDGIKVSDLEPKVSLKQTALYSRIKQFLNSGLVYKAKGSVYKLKERTLAETLNFRIKEIDSKFSSIVDVAKELDEKMKQAKPVAPQVQVQAETPVGSAASSEQAPITNFLSETKE